MNHSCDPTCWFENNVEQQQQQQQQSEKKVEENAEELPQLMTATRDIMPGKGYFKNQKEIE